MLTKHGLMALLVAAAPAVALAQSGNTAGNGAPQTGREFLAKVRKDSNNEVQEALLAEQRSTNPAVQAYARLLVSDHSTLISELDAVEPESGATATAGTDAQGPRAQSDRAEANFAGDTGAKFDRAFIGHEVEQNRESLSSWQKQAGEGGDLATFAKIGLAMQREHTALAQAIQTQLGSGNGE